MFFSTELLSRRDSGYALLWLAATIGAKLKKLPRREVVSADISQLSLLISQPPEPLALRLSSNLMVGLVRVYKMKHDLFETDVSTCVTSLKKAFHGMHNSTEAHDIMMANPNGLSKEALKAPEDPAMGMAMEFDIIEDWDMVFRRADEVEASTQECEFNLSFNPPESSFQAASQDLHQRKRLYQLDESHDHLFSSSFLNVVEAQPDDSSSSTNKNHYFADFDFGDGVDMGLGEEMERDLAKAWNLKLDRELETGGGGENDLQIELPEVHDLGFIQERNDFEDVMNEAFNFDHENPMHEADRISQCNMSLLPQINSPNAAAQIHPQDPTIRNGEPLRGIMKRHKDDGENGPASKKKRKKKVILLDPKTELSDEELKFHRYNYSEEMKRLRGEAKKRENIKTGKQQFEKLLWAPPTYFVSPELVEFWKRRVTYPVKAQEAIWRRGLEETDGDRREKRRRIGEEVAEYEERPDRREEGIDQENAMDILFDFDENRQEDIGGGFEATDAIPILDELVLGDGRSSDEPGQARHGSRNSSLPDSSLLFPKGIDLGQDEFGSNNLFPWDNAGPSSSSVMPVPGSASNNSLELNFDKTTVRIRRPSLRSGRQTSSPAVSLLGDLMYDEVPENLNDPIPFPETQGDTETQEVDNMVTLERNSFNFLEFAKMHQASHSRSLFFSDIVPVDSSSTRVAVEGFYHCLALATKNLIRLEQFIPYGPIKIEMK